MISIRRCLILVCLAFAMVPSSSARADVLNLTGAETAPNIAEIRFLDDRVNIRLEIYLEDLKIFADLIPDRLLKEAAGTGPSEAVRLERFSEKVFSILGPDGVALPVEVKLIEPRLRAERNSPFGGLINPQTGQRVPEAPSDKRVLYAELDYLFDGRPGQLTIVPPRDGDLGAIVSIGFIAYHKSVPIIDFRYLSDVAVLQLDWDDPWYSRFENPNLKRHHRNPLMSFLYMEPRQIRHEVLVRIRDLREWVDLDLSEGAMIGIDDRELLRDQASEFFKNRNRLRIDGELALPTVTRAEFLNISVGGLQVIEATDVQDLDPVSAIIGISQTYPVPNLPQKVTVEWDLFNDRIQRIPTTATDPAGPYRTFIDAQDPTIEWENFLLKYVDPQVAPVRVVGRSFGVPVLSVLLLVIAIVGAVLVFWPRYLPRTVWAGVSAVSVAAAVLVVPVMVIEVSNPLAGPPDEAESIEIIDAVLDNVHIAFLESVETELDSALSLIVDQSSFGDIKTELSRALAIKVAGGGIARVNDIENLVVTEIAALDGRRGFSSLAEWTALASAIHWGHPHNRRIRFRALMELGEIDGTWRLTGMTVVDASQES
jgi:hypothetical protein